MTNITQFPYNRHREYASGDNRLIAMSEMELITKKMERLEGRKGLFGGFLVRWQQPALARQAGELADFLAGRARFPVWLRKKTNRWHD